MISVLAPTPFRRHKIYDLSRSLTKKATQDNGDAVYGKSDTFFLFRAERRMRQDIPHSDERKTPRGNSCSPTV